MDIQNLRNFLEWMITPRTEEEKKMFQKEGLVDDYIAIKSRIPEMSFQDLVCEINKQIEPYGVSVDLLPQINSNE
jgi:hypothetical protein